MMKRIERYIGRTVLSSMILVTLVLIGLQLFIVFVNQVDDIGKGDYTLWTALLYVLLDMPYQVYLFFPVACLMGTLIGLGVLANHNELVILRASGMSIWNIIVSVFKIALLLILIVTLVGETLIPQLSRMAVDLKLQAISGGQSVRTKGGLWLRDGSSILYIAEILPDTHIKNIDQFQFNDKHEMQVARKIEHAAQINHQWVAYNVAQTEINDTSTHSSHIDTMPWPVNINPEILQISKNEPDEMSLIELTKYLKNQRLNHQSARNYELSFWQRLIQPFSCIVMMVLAIPFIFGPLRTSTLGSKLVTGATVGFGFHLIDRFFGPLSLVFQFPVWIAAVLPTLIFGIVAFYALKRVR